MVTTQLTASTAPNRLPIIGHTLSLARGPVRTLESLRDRGDVVLFYLGTHPIYLLNNPELISQVLVRDHDSFVKGRAFDKLRVFLGNGLATSEGEFHLRQRRMMTKAFHQDRLRAYTEIMRTQAESVADGWRAGDVVDVVDAMYELVARTTAKTLFKTDIGEGVIEEIQRWLPVFMRGTTLRVLSPVEAIGRLPIPANRRFAGARVRLRQIIDGIVGEYRRDPHDHGDLLSMLINATDEGSGDGMTESQLHDELMTIMFAGTETAGTALSWLWHELGRHADIETRVHEEIASLGSRPVTFDDLPRLSYARAVVKETLRLHCPVWLPMRRAAVDVEVGGVRIPAGADLLYSPAILHRDPYYYPDPHRFNPDRWLSGGAPEAFVPFGLGRHKCIGDHFALTEMAVIMTTIAARWRLRPVPGFVVREVPAGTLRPNRLPMRLVARDV